MIRYFKNHKIEAKRDVTNLSNCIFWSVTRLSDNAEISHGIEPGSYIKLFDVITDLKQIIK